MSFTSLLECMGTLLFLPVPFCVNAIFLLPTLTHYVAVLNYSMLGSKQVICKLNSGPDPLSLLTISRFSQFSSDKLVWFCFFFRSFPVPLLLLVHWQQRIFQETYNSVTALAMTNWFHLFLQGSCWVVLQRKLMSTNILRDLSFRVMLIKLSTANN